MIRAVFCAFLAIQSAVGKLGETNVVGTTISRPTRALSVCPPGTYVLSGACISCIAGRYSSSDATCCTQCSAGRYQTSTGASGCVLCTAGTYQPLSTGTTSCAICAAGRYSGTGATICVSCDMGLFQASTGASFCSNCIAGTYNIITGDDRFFL